MSKIASKPIQIPESIKFVINENLIMYRRHDGTFTDNNKNSYLKRIKFRLLILFRIIKLFMIK